MKKEMDKNAWYGKPVKTLALKTEIYQWYMPQKGARCQEWEFEISNTEWIITMLEVKLAPAVT